MAFASWVAVVGWGSATAGEAGIRLVAPPVLLLVSVRTTSLAAEGVRAIAAAVLALRGLDDRTWR